MYISSPPRQNIGAQDAQPFAEEFGEPQAQEWVASVSSRGCQVVLLTAPGIIPLLSVSSCQDNSFNSEEEK